MNPYIAYEAVNTKVAARKGRIFDSDRLEKILECETVEQVADVISSRYDIRQAADDAKLRNPHRDTLEMILLRFKVSEIVDILHYFSGPYREFLQTLLMESEIHDIVLMMRKIARGDEPDDIEKFYTHSGYSMVQFGKLASSKTVLQFIESLRNTHYYNVLKTVTSIDAVKREFHVEMKLQQLYYRTLVKKAEKLGERDRKAAEDIIGTRIDFLNVQWIFRAKKYYGISPEQILIYSLQGGKKLSFVKLKKLCYTKSIDEMKQLSDQLLRQDIFASDSGFAIDKKIESYLFAYLNERKFSGTIGTILSYIYRLDSAIKEFTAITEGIRYGLPKERLKQYLIRSK